MHLIPASFAYWCQETRLATSINNSMWAFAIIETVHIMGLAMLLGTIFVVDLRLMGVGGGKGFQGASELAMSLKWWTLSGLGLMIVTGICLYTSEAVKLMTNKPFFVKMVLVIFATAFHFTVHSRALRPASPDGTGPAKLIAYISIAAWFGIALAGRAIAFL
jgi:hypothetical protein